MNINEILTVTHVVSGTVAVAGMLLAWLSKKGSPVHRLGGRAFVLAMAVALFMAITISLLTRNLFLFLVALFSAHQIYSGWRLAVTRDGQFTTTDVVTTWLMLTVSLSMLLYGLFLLTDGSGYWPVIIVFGFLGGLPALADLRRAKSWPRGRERIALHLTRMGGGSIATTTAVFVVNIQTNPVFIGWLLPTVLFVPLITYFTRKVLDPKQPAVSVAK